MQAPKPTDAVHDPLRLRERILYRDADLIVLDKPAGLPVHPGPGGGANLADHLAVLRFDLPRDPELAHRLDKDTAGCLVLGRHRKALAKLASLFKAGKVDKTYWAIVEGYPTESEGLIEAPIAPRDPRRGWWVEVNPAGQPARTRFRVLGQAIDPVAGPVALMEMNPETGRTHQLRVHMAYAGHPILGDAIYGRAPRHGGPGLHLLARNLSIPFDPRKPAVTVTAKAPSPVSVRLASSGLIGSITQHDVMKR